MGYAEPAYMLANILLAIAKHRSCMAPLYIGRILSLTQKTTAIWLVRKLRNLYASE